MSCLIISKETKGIYKLTTAEILYFMPDYKDILQAYIWQEYDFDPYFPNLKRFLQFWEKELEGKLFTVKIATKKSLIVSPLEFANYQGRVH
jgi:uncharacterized protein Usg